MEKSALSRTMYITYKSRINASERLKKTNNFIQGINIYYSLFLTALSIYSVSAGTPRLSLVITIYSVVVTVTIVFLAAQNYGERAKSLKNNYVAISQLCHRLESVNCNEEVNNICNSYDELIHNSENHWEYDYYKAMIGISEERGKLSRLQKWVFYLLYWGSVLLKLFLISLPFLLKFLANILEWLISI